MSLFQNEERKLLSELGLMLQNYQPSLDEILLKFVVYLRSNFGFEKLSRKLESWHELTFGEFIKELNKAIKATNRERAQADLAPIETLSKKDEFDCMELFEENKAKAQDLQQQINTTEREIDRMVYELYGLIEEEIAIVES